MSEKMVTDEIICNVRACVHVCGRIYINALHIIDTFVKINI